MLVSFLCSEDGFHVDSYSYLDTGSGKFIYDNLVSGVDPLCNVWVCEKICMESNGKYIYAGGIYFKVSDLCLFHCKNEKCLRFEDVMYRSLFPTTLVMRRYRILDYYYEIQEYMPYKELDYRGISFIDFVRQCI